MANQQGNQQQQQQQGGQRQGQQGGTPPAPGAKPDQPEALIKQAVVTEANMKYLKVADLRGSFAGVTFGNDCITTEAVGEDVEAKVREVFGDAVEIVKKPKQKE